MRLVGSYHRSLTRDGARAPSVGSMEFSPVGTTGGFPGIIYFLPPLFLSGEFLTLLESHLLNAFPPRHTIFSLQAEIMTSFFDVI